MKQPDDSTIGGSRKTLPTRKARKIHRSTKPAALRTAPRSKNVFDKEAEQELVKVFGEK